MLTIYELDELIGFGKPASKTADWIVNTYLPNAPVSYRLSIEHAIAEAIVEGRKIGVSPAPSHSPAPGMVPFLRNFTMADDVPGGYDKDGQYAWKAGWNACADYVTGKRELPHLIHDILLKASRE